MVGEKLAESGGEKEARKTGTGMGGCLPREVERVGEQEEQEQRTEGTGDC